MASYRPFHPPPQSSFRPPLPAPRSRSLLQPPAPPQTQGNQNPQNWGTYSGKEGSVTSVYNQNYSQMNPSSNDQNAGYGPSSQQHFNPPPGNQPPPPPQKQQFPYQPPPSESSSYPPPVPAPPAYYPPSQFSQFNQPQSLQPLQSRPPLPSPHSSPPPPPPPPQPLSPPPPPSSVLPARFSTANRHAGEKSGHKNLEASSNQQQKPTLPPAGPVQRSDRHGQPGRVETEEEKRLRKKREYERLRQEEKHRHHLKESQIKCCRRPK